jgi:N-dimethylarginine dimethylaminohydrolase
MGVTSEYGRLRRVLLCKPDYFKWQPINETARRVIREGQSFRIEDVKRQHQELCDAFKSVGVEMLHVEPIKGLPYQVYTRDSGVTTKKGALLGRFREPVRQGEESAIEKLLIKEGIPVFGRVTKGVFEGGDVHYMDNETVACGLGARSNKEGIEEASRIMKEALGLNLITVPFPAKFLHLDEVFVRVAERLCLAHVEALPEFFLKMLRDKKIEIIDVSEEEVMELKCNVMSIDEKTIMSFKENTNTNERLEALGFEVLKPDIGILTRGGGGPRCSSFPLERDEV